MTSESDVRAAVPYGPAGLVVSLVFGLGLAALYSALGAGLVLAADATVFGPAHMLATLHALRLAWAAQSPAVLLVGYAAGILIYLAVAAALLSLAGFRGGADWRRLVAWHNEKAWWLSLRYWLLLCAAIVYGLCASAALSRFYPPSKNWFTLQPDPPTLLLTLVLVVAAAPFAEELLFRGWIYTSLRSRLGALASITVSALLFASVHYERTHLYALAVLPVGFILGVVRERTGTIWATATLHALYNFSGWLLTALGLG